MAQNTMSQLKNIKIRNAGLDDLKSLEYLYHEFHQFHVNGVADRLVDMKKPEQNEINPEFIKAVKGIIESENSEMFVAEINNEIIGCVEIYLKKDEPSPQKKSYSYVYVQSLIVTEKHRGYNIGSLLMDAVNNWANKKKADEIRLDIWEFPEGPLGFYEKKRYQTLRRTMVKKIDR